MLDVRNQLYQTSLQCFTASILLEDNVKVDAALNVAISSFAPKESQQH